MKENLLHDFDGLMVAIHSLGKTLSERRREGKNDSKRCEGEAEGREEEASSEAEVSPREKQQKSGTLRVAEGV
jgi:hypothetical protein